MFDSNSCLVVMSSSASKKRAVTKFDNWLKSQKPLDIIVYTDSSQKIDKGNTYIGTGARWVLS